MTNQLIYETSPYLLQHAKNPVEWFAWNEKSLSLAKTLDKPILLSIGYAACHWCHVMESECFEKPQIAEIMNRHFVCIKVDREERPDLDKIYQLSHQMLTERPGGWPLTMALTPKGHAPFFAGTYFPPEPRHNLPGFGALLLKLSAHYEQHKKDLMQHYKTFNKALSQLNPTLISEDGITPEQALSQAVGKIQNQFDSTFGGLGGAPKFPHPTQLQLLLYGGQMCTGKLFSQCKKMVNLTLMKMAMGGIYDQLGGGFFRYCVDRQWHIPHFEKMLYDNGQLLALYADWHTSLVQEGSTNNAIALFHCKTVLTQTAKWVMSEMQLKGGGYAATMDADSEGEEGRFYVWAETDLRVLLNEQEYHLLEDYFALFGEPNFEGKWHFNQNSAKDTSLLLENTDILMQISSIKNKLLSVRGERIKPLLNDNILTAWNGLMIKGMAKAALALDAESLVTSAQQSVDFIRKNLWQGKRLLASCRDGKARLKGYLDDYAFLLEGLMVLLQTKWRTEDLTFAIEVADAMIAQFEDHDSGGFYFTAHDHEKLLYRPKSGADDSIPSGNASAIAGLLQLGYLLGKPEYIQSAEKTLKLFSNELIKQPSVNALMTLALQQASNDFVTVVVFLYGKEGEKWESAVKPRISHLTQVFLIRDCSEILPRTLESKKVPKKNVAYLCQGQTCLAPMYDLPIFLKQLDSL